MWVLRLLLGLFVTICVLVIAAILIIPAVFDPNDYRQEITDLVKEQTGRTITIDGELKLSVFPWLGVQTGRFTIDQPRHLSADFGEGKMLAVDAVNVRLKMLPLLKSLNLDKKNIQVDTIILDQPQIELITTSDGISSLDGLAGQNEGANGNSAEANNSQQDQKAAAQAGIALVVKGIDLKSGSIIWDDRQNQQRIVIQNLNIQSGDLLGESLETLSVSADISQGEPVQQSQLSLKTKARIDLATLTIETEQLNAEYRQNDIALDLKVPDMVFHQQHNEGFINSLNAKGSFQQTPFDIQLSQFAFNVEQQAASIQGINLASDLAKLAGLPSLKAQVNIDDVRVNALDERLSVKQVVSNTEGVQTQIQNIRGHDLLSDLALSGSLHVLPFNLQQLLNKLEIDYQPSSPTALSNLALSTNFNAGLHNASLRDLVFTLDESQINGTLSVLDFSKPNARFDLALNQLNVDGYIPESAEANNEQSSSAGGLAALFALFPIFEQYKANGQFTADSLIASGLKINDFKIKASSSQSDTTIDSQAALYSGRYSSQIKYERLNNGARLNFNNAKLQNVNLEPLLIDGSFTEQLSGIASMGLNLSIEQIAGVQSSSGSVKVALNDGAIKGVDIQKIATDAGNLYNQLKGREITDQGVEQSETRFASLLGTFNLRDNIIENVDLDMKAPLFRVSGAGMIDLLQQDVDYTAKVSIVNSLQGQGGEALEKLKGVTLPVRFTGPITNPQYKVDIQSLAKAKAREELDQKKEELIKEKLGIEGGGKLSTKEILGAALNKKLQDKLQAGQSSGDQANTANTENSVQPQTAEQNQEKTKDQVKEELKQDLKKRVLDQLFGN
jgi:AsmA protein